MWVFSIISCFGNLCRENKFNILQTLIEYFDKTRKFIIQRSFQLVHSIKNSKDEIINVSVPMNINFGIYYLFHGSNERTRRIVRISSCSFFLGTFWIHFELMKFQTKIQRTCICIRFGEISLCFDRHNVPNVPVCCFKMIPLCFLFRKESKKRKFFFRTIKNFSSLKDFDLFNSPILNSVKHHRFIVIIVCIFFIV